MTLGPVMADLAGVALEPDEREMLRHPRVGSVILFTRNYESPEQLRRLVAEIHAIRTPPLLVAVDHEGGRVQRFQSGFTRLPALREVGRRYAQSRSEGLELARELGWLMAAELRAVGVDMSFAPCVDIDYGVSRAIGDRALSADAGAVGNSRSPTCSECGMQGWRRRQSIFPAMARSQPIRTWRSRSTGANGPTSSRISGLTGA